MKKVLLTAALSLPLLVHAQQWLGSLVNTGDIYRAGNVGIGTITVPQAQLHVGTTGTTQFMVERTASGNQSNWLKIFFTSNPAAGVSVGGGSTIFQQQNPNSISDMVFMQNTTTAGMILKSSGRVGIGNVNPAYTLDVTGSGNFTTTLRVGSGALVSGTTVSGSSTGYALATWCSSPSWGGAYLEGLNTGAYGIAGIHTSGGPNPVEAIGLWGIGGPLGSNKGVGVHGDGQGSFYSVGVWGQALGGAVYNYGVWGETPSWAGYAGYFSGDVYCTGSYLPSDKNLKKDIREVTNALGILQQLNTYTYQYRTTEYPHLNLSDRKQYGFLSQEVEAVLPELIKQTVQPDQFDDQGNLVHPSVEFKAINYMAIIPLLVEGMKEQQKQIEELTDRLNRLEAGDLNVNMNSVASLEQNSPNPFSESTTIRYYLPETSGNAQITITDLNGVTLKTISLQQKGHGRVTLQAGELQAGTYTYMLTVDGNIINSYKMVLTR